jgi:hypothetical protein
VSLVFLFLSLIFPAKSYAESSSTGAWQDIKKGTRGIIRGVNKGVKKVTKKVTEKIDENMDEDDREDAADKKTEKNKSNDE